MPSSLLRFHQKGSGNRTDLRSALVRWKGAGEEDGAVEEGELEAAAPVEGRGGGEKAGFLPAARDLISNGLGETVAGPGPAQPDTSGLCKHFGSPANIYLSP